MPARVDVAVDVIVHATEDPARLLAAIEAALGLGAADFGERTAEGHYGNPISVLSSRVSGRRARDVLARLVGGLTEAQLGEVAGGIGDSGGALHVRLAKQGLVGGRMELSRGDPVRIRISTPSYGGGSAGALAGLLGRDLDLIGAAGRPRPGMRR